MSGEGVVVVHRVILPLCVRCDGGFWREDIDLVAGYVGRNRRIELVGPGTVKNEK